jgi:PTS system nitrogen regulatory IIA component
MTLTVRDASRLLNVSEKTLYRWIAERGLPAQRIGDQYRLNRAEILEWATANRVNASPQLFGEPDEAGLPLPTLEEALSEGGVFYRIEGRDQDEVLRSLVAVLRLPEGTDPVFLFEVLRARERIASTAIGGGIAIPHPRHPLVLHVARPSVTLCFLEQPVNYGALDGEPVSALFTILSPTVRAHLHLLSVLAFGLQQPSFRRAIEKQAARLAILREASRVDALCREARERSARKGSKR